MRTYKRKVAVQDGANHHLFTAHAEYAKLMVRMGDATIPDRQGKVWRIVITRATNQQPTASDIHTLQQMQEQQRYTYRHKTSNPGLRVHTFKALYRYNPTGLLERIHNQAPQPA